MSLFHEPFVVPFSHASFLWNLGSLDQDYLTSNPDGITRLFCGNLNKKITEEELKSCLEGLTHIKVIFHYLNSIFLHLLH